MESVSALPNVREVFSDVRGADRVLRVTAHPELDLVVLSYWHADRCVATAQIAAADLPALVNALVEGLAELG